MYDELVKRLHSYSENCVAYKLDADFADAVQQAADAIEELSKPKWIPVTERLPEDDGFTLIFTEHGNPGVCYFTCGWWGGYDKDGITHWMPIPEPPKEET